MKTFEEFITENTLNEQCVNLIGDKIEVLTYKEKYKNTIYDLIQTSYAKIGGIKQNGFNSPDDMVVNIPYWKLVRKNNEIVAGRLYKDKGGRKCVASFTNGTTVGKEALSRILVEDLDRSMGEISGAALGFIIKIAGLEKIKKYAIDRNKAQNILKKNLSSNYDEYYSEKYPELSEFFYSREIDSSSKTKILIGTPGMDIVYF